jgi:hypothetical protein
MAQAFTGQQSKPGPNMLTKAMGKAWQKLSSILEGEGQGFLDIPIFNPSTAEVERADLWLVASNAIASRSSVTLKNLPHSLQDHLTTPPAQVEQVVLPVKKVYVTT